MFVDDGLVKDSLGTSLANTLRLPNARADLIIDEDASAQQISANLRKLELIAKKNKVAVGIGSAYPATVLQVSRWVKTLPGKKNSARTYLGPGQGARTATIEKTAIIQMTDQSGGPLQ